MKNTTRVDQIDCSSSSNIISEYITNVGMMNKLTANEYRASSPNSLWTYPIDFNMIFGFNVEITQHDTPFKSGDGESTVMKHIVVMIRYKIPNTIPRKATPNFFHNLY